MYCHFYIARKQNRIQSLKIPIEKDRTYSNRSCRQFRCGHRVESRRCESKNISYTLLVSRVAITEVAACINCNNNSFLENNTFFL